MRTLKTAAVGIALLGGSLALAACGDGTDAPADDPAVEDPAVEDPAVEDPAVEDPAVEEEGADA